MKDSENGKTVNSGRLKLCNRQVTQRWKGECVRVCVCAFVFWGECYTLKIWRICRLVITSLKWDSGHEWLR